MIADEPLRQARPPRRPQTIQRHTRRPQTIQHMHTRTARTIEIDPIHPEIATDTVAIEEVIIMGHT